MAGDGDDEEIVTGTEGEGADGSDSGGRDEDAEVSAEHADPEEDDGEQVEPEVGEQQARGSRGGNRIQRLANEAKAAREEAAAARREAEEARRAATQRQHDQSEEARQARRALMTPEERVSDDMAQMRREFAQQRQQDQFATWSMLDKSNYDAKALSNPVYAKFADQVEAKFQETLRSGQPVQRDLLLKLVLGERALSGARDPGAKKAAKARVESQRVSAGSGRGDVRSERGRAGDTAESRLKGQII